MKLRMPLPLFVQIQQAGVGAWREDVLAGVITAILLIPQGMAYALLAGLPAELGLYAAIVPPVLYALFGSSRSLAVGPAAVPALMVAAALADYAAGQPEKWISGSVILAFEAGVLLFVMGLLRMGRLVNFISHPVLSGFTTGAALLIILSQIPGLAGLALEPGGAQQTVLQLWQQRASLDSLTMIFSAAAVATLLLSRKPLVWLLTRLGVMHKTASLISRMAPLLVVLLSIVWAASSDAASAGLAILGPVPAALPWPSLALFATGGWLQLAGPASLIALVAYVESVSVAKVLAARRRQKLDPDQELRALGLANIASAWVGSMPVAGSFSRSVVNLDAGSQTQRSALVASVLVAVVAMFFTQWFFHLPTAVLAAIIVTAVWQLVDFASIRQHLAYDWADGFSQLITLGGVLLLGIEPGLVLGIGLSLVLYLWRTSQPHIAVLGRLPDTEHFRNIQRHEAETLPHVLMLRPDENLYFANVAVVQKFIADQVAERAEVSDVVVVMSAVNYVDASGLDMLEQLAQDFSRAGIQLHLAEVKGPVMDRLKTVPRVLQQLPVHLTSETVFESLGTGAVTSQAHLRRNHG